MEGLLNKKKIVSRSRKMPSIIEKKLRTELEEIDGFNSYNQDLRKGSIYSTLVRYEVRNSSREAFAPLCLSKTNPTNRVHV